MKTKEEQLKKPVSEKTSHTREKLRVLHLNDQVSWGGTVHPLAGLFMHIGTQGGEINKLPMSLHPTTPSWLRWSCGIHLLWRGKSLNAATSKKVEKHTQQVFSLTFRWSQLITCCINTWYRSVDRHLSKQTTTYNMNNDYDTHFWIIIKQCLPCL